MTRKFECHITVEWVPNEMRDRIAGYVEPWGFRLAKLFMQPNLQSRKDTFCTAHASDLLHMQQKMQGALAALRLHHIAVYRAKIEEILYDERFPQK